MGANVCGHWFPADVGGRPEDSHRCTHPVGHDGEHQHIDAWGYVCASWENDGTTGHHVITVERQGGYAARCACGNITFGGNSSRLEARRQLRNCVEASGRDVDGRFLSDIEIKFARERANLEGVIQ